MDYNFHPPTNYFPLIVHEALMIEPTETENKDTLDRFADALIKIAEEAKTQPELSPQRTEHHPIRSHGRGEGVRESWCSCCWLPKFWLDPVRNAREGRFRKSDLRNIEHIIEDNLEFLLNAWKEEKSKHVNG
jgi:hypothetical protein